MALLKICVYISYSVTGQLHQEMMLVIFEAPTIGLGLMIVHMNHAVTVQSHFCRFDTLDTVVLFIAVRCRAYGCG